MRCRSFCLFLKFKLFVTKPLRTAVKVGGKVYSSLCTLSFDSKQIAVLDIRTWFVRYKNFTKLINLVLHMAEKMSPP